jgi:hypothetical protein
MYWWNVSKLAEDLREGRVDEKERFKYFLATFIAWNILVVLFIYSGGPFDADRLISAAVFLTIAIIGIILCYRVNKNGDNADFIGRMICLGWPASVQLAAALSGLILTMVSFFGLHDVIFKHGSFFSATVNMLWKLREFFFAGPILGICFFFSYYLRIGACLALVARVKGAEEARQAATMALSDSEIVIGLVGGIGFLFITMYGFVLMPEIVGLRSLAELLTFLGAGLWLMLFLLIISWSRQRRLTKPSSSPNHANQ